jgi:hypothetical protein
MKPKKKYLLVVSIIILSTIVLFIVCALIAFRPSSSQQKMLTILHELRQKNNNINNGFNSAAKLAYCDSLLRIPGNKQNISLKQLKASLLLKVGKEQDAVNIYEPMVQRAASVDFTQFLRDAGIAYMRLGERSNCMLNHNRSSCIFPIKDGGIHLITTGSQKAIDVYETILKKHPDDLASKWLLNIAFMTLGRYPKDVPPEFLIPDMDKDKSNIPMKPFDDMAGDLGLNIFGRAGGVIVDDFNNDGYLDIVTSGWTLEDPMHYFQNNRDGTFTDMTEQSGLKGFTGGLNIQQIDYNNDGNMDIFILRGAWGTQGFGNQPSSLLRNDGNGKFTDVTIPSGLLFFAPTQTATWADFNHDGWLDVFIGTEDSGIYDQGGVHFCALYINNQDGTFTNVAEKAHCDIQGYVKGVTSADFNNDGWPDIFVSTLNGKKFLLQNTGRPGAIPEFKNVSDRAGLASNNDPTFATWFFDYNNDGWPDIMAAEYRYEDVLSYYAAAEAVGKPVARSGNIFLYRNNHDGTFTDVTKENNLDKAVFAMGANFGDIDNDGYQDMYFGTGNPDFQSLIPNKLFKNVDGKHFADVTISSRTGNLQKGHGVAFADLRNTGLQDIFIEMGGAYKGDSYNSSLYVNPGQNNNNWISLQLSGVKANRAAIGSRIKLTITENGIRRSIYKDVNSGGSFGSSPLRQEIGIGQARIIDDIEICWAGSGTIQHFRNVKPCQFLHITEGNPNAAILHLKRLVFLHKATVPMCMPIATASK